MRPILKKRKYRELRELKGLLLEKGITYKELAKSLKIGIAAVSDKINGTSTFDISEANKIVEVLGIADDQVTRYFFWCIISETQNGGNVCKN